MPKPVSQITALGLLIARHSTCGKASSRRGIAAPWDGELPAANVAACCRLPVLHCSMQPHVARPLGRSRRPPNTSCSQKVALMTALPLKTRLHPAPARQVDVLHLLLVQLLAHVIEEAILVVQVQGEVREAGLRYHVLDRQLPRTPRCCRLCSIEGIPSAGHSASRRRRRRSARSYSAAPGEQVVGDGLTRRRARWRPSTG